MARLLLITHEFTITGATWILCRLGLHLASRGHSVKVLASQDMQGALLRHFEAGGIPVIRHVSTADFDVVIGNTLLAAPVLLKLASHTRTVWWVHEGEIGVNALIKQPAWIGAFRQCMHIVFQSAFQRDHIYRSFIHDLPPDRFSIIPNGVGPFPRVDPVPRQRRLRVLCVGSIYPRKRQEDLIRAIDALKREDVECVLLGKEVIPLEPPIQSIIQSNPQTFRVVGELEPDAVQAFYSGSDVFSLPSSSESQPLTAFEAGSNRLPLVLTDLGGYQGIWRHGHNCLMHGIGDVRVLAGTLAMLLQDSSLRARLGNAAAVTAAAYRFDAFAGNFEALIHRLVAMERPQP